jgi:hypothetical protein
MALGIAMLVAYTPFFLWMIIEAYNNLNEVKGHRVTKD